MKWKTAFFLIVLAIGMQAQKKDPDDFTSCDIYYGSRAYFNDFYGQLNSAKRINPSIPVRTIGIGASGHFVVQRGSNFYGHMIYSKVLPETIRLNDSLNGKIGGFMISFAYGASLQGDAGKAALYIYLGANTGRLKITGNELLKQKNPFFAPKIGLQPRFRLGRLVLTCIAEYEYDLSKKGWRRMTFSTTAKTNIAALRQTALTVQLGVGWTIE